MKSMIAVAGWAQQCLALAFVFVVRQGLLGRSEGGFVCFGIPRDLSARQEAGRSIVPCW